MFNIYLASQLGASYFKCRDKVTSEVLYGFNELFLLIRSYLNKNFPLLSVDFLVNLFLEFVDKVGGKVSHHRFDFGSSFKNKCVHFTPFIGVQKSSCRSCNLISGIPIQQLGGCKGPKIIFFRRDYLVESD